MLASVDRPSLRCWSAAFEGLQALVQLRSLALIWTQLCSAEPLLLQQAWCGGCCQACRLPGIDHSLHWRRSADQTRWLFRL